MAFVGAEYPSFLAWLLKSHTTLMTELQLTQ